MTLQIGIDEAGRGPLAGPVTAACAVLVRDDGISGLADSKKLSASRRDALSAILRKELHAWGLGWAWPAEIDELNIHRATLLAMQRAFQASLERWPVTPPGGPHRASPNPVGHPVSVTGAPSAPLPGDFPVPVYVDGKFVPELPVSVEAVVGGDATVPSIQAASILAKTARDRWMLTYARQEPQYRFEKHKGYPTPEHKELIRRHGPSRIHRYSFNASLSE